jgi:hypothetical protein
MLFKVVLLVIFVGILISLALALKGLVNPDPEVKGKMVKNLAWRVGLSVLVMGMLF